MSDELIPLSRYLASAAQNTLPVACHRGRAYHAAEFRSSVRRWVERLQEQPFRSYALYTQDAYPFAVLLLALFHAGKEVWIPGNNRPGTAEQLAEHGCRLIGDWHSHDPMDYRLDGSADSGKPFAVLSPGEVRLMLFTSGSTGHAKPVGKTLRQLEAEIAALEKQWGRALGGAVVLSTVSHQHIYGLLFRVAWPLFAGRCFHSELFLDPETLIAAARHSAACWVASPAQLKRMNRHSPWQGIGGLKAVFSSGGPLPSDAAEQIRSMGGQAVVEIFGSTETGGIAWRQHGPGGDATWKLFEGLTLTPRDDRWLLHSPYLPECSGWFLDDKICLQNDGSFVLQGRHDRVVKIEEKRLSLTELECRLQESAWVEAAHAVKLSLDRDMAGAVVVLSPAGLERLKEKGRRRVVRELRAALSNWFEAVTVPRKWLFSDAVPLTAQGKVDEALIVRLLAADPRKWPLIQEINFDSCLARLRIRVPERLIYFPDHFERFPILPGVVQIAWAERFGNLVFSINQPFKHMEVIKFVKLIRPGDELTLLLEWSPASGKLYFTFSSDLGVHSSGRLVYGAAS